MYWKLMRMGKTRALYAVPKDFRYYNEQMGMMAVGRGMEKFIRNYIEEHGYEYEIKDETHAPALSGDLSGDVQLREYQQGDIETITAHRTGVIRLGTGYGKTVLACALTKKLGYRTLIVVPRSHLLDQFAQEFKKYYGYDVGVVQGKVEEIKGVDITVASIQTLINRPALLRQYGKHFGLVIVDECHGFITKKRMIAIQSFAPKYLYGLTATPRRTDEQGKAIFFTFGDVIIDKDLERAAPEVEIVEFDGHIQMSENYSEIIDEQINNDARNEIITTILRREIANSRRVLVLTKRVEHYQTLSRGENQNGIYTVDSSSPSKERFALLERLRAGESDFRAIFGTFSLLSTGTDIPALDTLIFAGDLRSDVLQEQSVGRILRLFGDKQRPKIIDVVDTGNHILHHQAKARMKFYQKMGWL